MQEEYSGDRNQTLLMVLLVEGGAGVLAIVVGWLFSQQPIGELRWTSRAILLGIVGTLPMLVMFGVVYGLRSYGPFREIDAIFRNLMMPVLAPCSAVDLILISALAGVGEELLFRGVVQALFVHWIGPLAGLLAASVLFGFAHMVTPAYAVITTLAGIYLGWLYMATGNLAPVIIAHGLYDAIALIYVVKLHPPDPPDADKEAADLSSAGDETELSK